MYKSWIGNTLLKESYNLHYKNKCSRKSQMQYVLYLWYIGITIVLIHYCIKQIYYK